MSSSAFYLSFVCELRYSVRGISAANGQQLTKFTVVPQYLLNLLTLMLTVSYYVLLSFDISLIDLICPHI